MDHLNLELLRTFISVVELNGFNRAAVKVHRSQSTISMQMKKLEEVAGGGLFEKKGKKHVLTNQGEVLLSYAKRILELNDQALQTLKETKLKGKVRVGLQFDFAESTIREALFKFSKTHSEIMIDLRIDSSDVLQQQLSGGKLDIAVYLARERNPGLDSSAMGNFPVKWIYSPLTKVLPAEGSRISLAVLGPNCKIRQMASSALSQAGIPWHIAFSSSSLAATFGAVAAGIGISARTIIGLPPSLKFVPAGAGLPKLPVVTAFLCTAINEDALAVLRLKDFLLGAVREKLHPDGLRV
jgi:DNA-binding transcriptional LysR family regulator